MTFVTNIRDITQTIQYDGCERTVIFTLLQLPCVKVIRADRNTQLIEIIFTNNETEKADFVQFFPILTLGN